MPDTSVTSLALQLAQNNMAPVRKEDMIRFLIDMFPWNNVSFFLKLSDLFFFRGFGYRFFMAFEAGV